MVQMNFNATQYDPYQAGMDIFETGEYTFQIIGSEVKPTRSGNGQMLVFTLSCLDEGLVGRRLTIRLNIVNANPQAVDIAFRELSAISHVCGILNWQDTQQLHGRPFRVRVEKVPRSDDPTKFGNEVKGYLDINGQPPGKNGASASAAPAAPTAPPVPPAAPPHFAPPQNGASAPPPPVPPAAPPAPPPSAPPAAPPAPQPWATPPFAQPSEAPTAGNPVPPWLQQ